jgi:hypothetical protein
VYEKGVFLKFYTFAWGGNLLLGNARRRGVRGDGSSSDSLARTAANSIILLAVVVGIKELNNFESI